MKIGWPLGLLLLLSYTAMPPAAMADSDSASPNVPVLDPDGVPLTVTQSQSKQPTQAEIDAYQKQQQQMALDKDWLLRNYEHQQQIRGDATTSRLYQISSDKDLSKLSGLPSLGSASPEQSPSLRTGAANNALTLRANPSSQMSSISDSAFHESMFKPLVTPLSSPQTLGLHDSYTFLSTGSTPLPPQSNTPKTSRTSELNQEEPSAMEMPGLTAAESDPLLDKSTDLTLDVLPGESIEEAKAHQDSPQLKLSLPNDITQLHKQQTASLKPPSVVKTTAQQPINPVLLPDPNEPTPDKVPQPNPIHSPIADPHDIFYR